MNQNPNNTNPVLCGQPSSKQNRPKGNNNTTSIHNTMTNFRQMEKLLLEGDPAQRINPSMRIAAEPQGKMSVFSSGMRKKTPYGTYRTTNYDRYTAKNTTEQDAFKATEELRKTLYWDLAQKLEKLADFQGNDDIIRVYDEFISNLYTQAGVKL